MDGIQITGCKDGINMKVERILFGQVVSRYITADLSKPPKNPQTWMVKTAEYFNQPKANIQIEVPPVPTLIPTQGELQGRTISELTALVEQLRKGEVETTLLPDRDYSCGSQFCDDPACNTHGPKDSDGDLLYWKDKNAVTSQR